MFYRRKALGHDTRSCKGFLCRLPFFFTFIQVYTKTRKIGLHSYYFVTNISRTESMRGPLGMTRGSVSFTIKGRVVALFTWKGNVFAWAG
jgi:hypothetical protein